MSWFRKQKTLGNYVKYSDHTAKINPQMILDAFSNVYNKYREEIHSYKRQINDIEVYIEERDYNTTTRDVDKVRIISVKHLRFEPTLDPRNTVTGVDAIRKILKKHDITIEEIERLENILKEIENERKKFYRSYVGYEGY